MQHSSTNVTLSQYESELVTNAQVLLTKNEIIKKVYALFGDLAETYTKSSIGILPDEVIEKPPKISRGENYNGLPYVMLDYPRRFGREDTFAIRTFFWWGNFFSITLQLSGGYKKLLLPKLTYAAEQNLLNDWHIGINENKWLHEFSEANYAIITSNNLAEEMENVDTLKLAKYITLAEWDGAAIFLENNFKFLLSKISS
jgi:hypothetical protein